MGGYIALPSSRSLFKTNMVKVCARSRRSNGKIGDCEQSTQTAVTNICLKCITFINLTFRMLQHTSSEVINIQLQRNLNSKIQLYGLGTNEID